jgi:hypothetical protein
MTVDIKTNLSLSRCAQLKQKNSLFKRVRLVIRDSYNHWITQAVFGGLILANFLSNVIESQMMPLRPVRAAPFRSTPHL